MNRIHHPIGLMLGLGTILLSTTFVASAQEAASAPGTTLSRMARIHIDPTCAPAMPMIALRANAQGTTRLQFSVDASGRPTAVEIVGSAGQGAPYRALDAAAARDLSNCKFEPGLDASGQPTATQPTVSYTWRLE